MDEEFVVANIMYVAIIVILIIFSISNARPNPCAKYGDDWSFVDGSAGGKQNCVNSNGDIKYIKD